MTEGGLYKIPDNVTGKPVMVAVIETEQNLITVLNWLNKTERPPREIAIKKSQLIGNYITDLKKRLDQI